MKILPKYYEPKVGDIVRTLEFDENTWPNFVPSRMAEYVDKIGIITSLEYDPEYGTAYIVHTWSWPKYALKLVKSK